MAHSLFRYTGISQFFIAFISFLFFIFSTVTVWFLHVIIENNFCFYFSLLE